MLGYQRQHFFDVMDEAHVQHTVGFVEHQNLYLTQVQRTLACVVEQAARRCDQNVYATAQFFNLRAHADTAKHHHGCQLKVFAIDANAFFNLRSQLARGRHDEAAHSVDTAPVGEAWLGAQALQHWQHKGRRFAGAGLCTTQKVAACQHSGNRLHLNRGWGFVALFEYGFKYGRSQIQFFKGHCVAPLGAF